MFILDVCSSNSEAQSLKKGINIVQLRKPSARPTKGQAFTDLASTRPPPRHAGSCPVEIFQPAQRWSSSGTPMFNPLTPGVLEGYGFLVGANSPSRPGRLWKAAEGHGKIFLGSTKSWPPKATIG